jgi:hypothetical protein
MQDERDVRTRIAKARGRVAGLVVIDTELLVDVFRGKGGHCRPSPRSGSSSFYTPFGVRCFGTPGGRQAQVDVSIQG